MDRISLGCCLFLAVFQFIHEGEAQRDNPRDEDRGSAFTRFSIDGLFRLLEWFSQFESPERLARLPHDFLSWHRQNSVYDNNHESRNRINSDAWSFSRRKRETGPLTRPQEEIRAPNYLKKNFERLVDSLLPHPNRGSRIAIGFPAERSSENTRLITTTTTTTRNSNPVAFRLQRGVHPISQLL